MESIVEEKKIEISKDLEAVLARESAIKKSLGESKEKMENLQVGLSFLTLLFFSVFSLFVPLSIP